MGLIRYCTVTACCMLLTMYGITQQVWYPADASQLLKSTAEDVAMLLQKAGAGKITAQAYSNVPSSGWILTYDESMKGNQSCKAKSDGSNFIQFSAAEDNGLNFGVYQYLYEQGFRFYQPGPIWEIIPPLQSSYRKIDTVYSEIFKYKTWFISGGYGKWALDKNPNYDWDIYGGENGHEWSMYMRRNNMIGAYRFTGHRDEIMTQEYLEVLKNNPCFVAPYNGSRTPTNQSVSDINSTDAMKLWSSGIESQFTQFRNNIYNNKNIYPNLFHNFSYAYGNIGIEVPDGAHWANSTDNSGCSYISNVSESDQHFTLANFTTAQLKNLYPDKRYQLYAYDGHANVPSSKINIDDKMDVQVVASAFQNETSTKGLLNRWYSRNKNISEYHYLNLPQWSGETPAFFLNDLNTTLQRLHSKKAQGLVIETSPAKFANLPFLLAANNNLKDNVEVSKTLREFCDNLFGSASATIYQLLQYWSNERTVMLNNGIQDNKYKLALYYSLVNKAASETNNNVAVVKERITELKAYLHYMSLYYDWIFDQRSSTLKSAKAVELCNYLAVISQMKIVNSYFLIKNIVDRYSVTDNIYIQYNTINGTAYQNNFSFITNGEIEKIFQKDLSLQQINAIDYNLLSATEVKKLFEQNNMLPLEKINLKINYTNAKDYSTRTEFYLIADAAGSFSIQYTPMFSMPGNGYINFTVEDVDKALGVVKDYSLHNGDAKGNLVISLPSAGTYKLSVVSKYKSAVDLIINTNGNYFYKSGPYLGNTIENYRTDLLSLPGYFYVPKGISKVYFSLNNSNPGGSGFASPVEIDQSFAFKNNEGSDAKVHLSSVTDSALFYLDIPAGNSGAFWQAFKMEGYRLCFSNISNLQWYARRKPCSELNFSVTFQKNSTGECITQLKPENDKGENKWRIYDALKWYKFNDKKMLDVPGIISPNAIITLSDQSNCIVTKRLGNLPGYFENKEKCASGAIVSQESDIVVYPNPSTGVYWCKKGAEFLSADNIVIFNSGGTQVASFNHTHTFNITNLSPGFYLYKIISGKVCYQGKLIKH